MLMMTMMITIQIHHLNLYHNVNDDDDDYHTDPPSEFVPVNENSRNNTL
jgi:hypothetical protein